MGRFALAIFGAALFLAAGGSHAAVITFDEAIAGATSFGFDGDGDGVDDVVFTTTDPSGFNTAGPGPNQNFINEPGLEGTSSLSPDLRVDFLNGASDSIGFGFALSTGLETFGVDFSIFDAGDVLLGSQSATAEFGSFGPGTTGFPEGQVSLAFAGVASYATFDFNNDPGRYIIDNFEGTFGSTEEIGGGDDGPVGTAPIPEPGSASLFALGGILVGAALRRRQD